MRGLLKKMVSALIYAKCIFLYALSLFLSLFLCHLPRYRKLWLISERGSDARDNGYHFFKYLCEHQPEVNCAYVIDKRSPDYDKVRALGRVVQRGSFRHYLAFAGAKALISTHIMGYTPDTYRFGVLDRKFHLVRGKKVFLQHGIIKDNIAELHYPKVNLDIFVCSTVPEYEDLMKDYHFPEGVIQRLGLCRYDALLSPHEVKRQILVMPTWRYYARELSDDGFKESEYYQCFNGLISDERLHRLLEENDYELVLYLHYELQKFTKLFDGNHKRVQVRGMGDADVQQLLMESSLLVTDYSSVFFDFAFMKKPLAYWQFDSERFFAEQYGKGYFRFDEDGFGPLCTQKEEVIRFIEDEFRNGMAVEEKYAKRVEHNFSEFSTDHSQKTYEAVLKLLSSK